MKRLLIVLTLFLALSLAGCETDGLGEYKKAAEKTSAIERGQTSGDIFMTTDFNTDGMTAEEIKELNYYKDIEVNFNASYDYGKEKAIYKNYMNIGGLGIDYEFFVNDGDMFIKLPIVGKYLNLNDIKSTMSIETNLDEAEEQMISPRTIEAVSAKWVGVMKKDDVFKGEDIVLTTPDGEVKTTEYTIKLTDEQIKELYIYTIDTATQDEKLKSFYEKYLKQNANLCENKSYEVLLEDLKENINDYKIESFNYTAYVDIDGYIVDEVVDVTLKVINSEGESLSKVNYIMNIKNWDINKEQNFKFPQLTKENTINTDGMEENMPDLFENMFNGME